MLEALGDLGDFLGGIGVMITVIYLALQIRHNTRGLDQNNDLMQLSFENEMRHEMMQFRLGIATDEGLTELWTRGVAGLSELSPGERDRFDLLMYNVLSMMNAQFDAHSRGLYERGQAPFFRVLVTTPGFREWWVQRRELNREVDEQLGARLGGSEFRVHLEAMLARAAASPPEEE